MNTINVSAFLIAAFLTLSLSPSVRAQDCSKGASTRAYTSKDLQVRKVNGDPGDIYAQNYWSTDFKNLPVVGELIQKVQSGAGPFQLADGDSVLFERPILVGLRRTKGVVYQKLALPMVSCATNSCETGGFIVVEAITKVSGSNHESLICVLGLRTKIAPLVRK